MFWNATHEGCREREHDYRAERDGGNPINNGSTILYRPVGPRELDLIRRAGWRRFPLRLPEQAIFYPVLNESYATQIARDWNVKANGAGFVTKFAVSTDYLKKFEIHVVGGSEHAEYWIPSDLLDEFNQHIVGNITVISEFPSGALKNER